MNATAIKDGIDRVETGLPDHLDLGPVLARGRRLRRRRQAGIGLGIGLGVAAVAAAVAVPAGLLSGSGDAVRDPADDPTTSATSAPTTPVDPSIAGEAFGAALEAKVQTLFPGYTKHAENLADHINQTGMNGTIPALRYAVNDPVDWPHLFYWQQFYTRPDGSQLILATQWHDLRSGETFDSYTPCRHPAPSGDATCDETPLGDGRTLVVEQGLYAANTGEWFTTVRVTTDPTRQTSTDVSVSVSADGDSWADAKAKLPDVQALTDLATDPSVVLPEPGSIPVVQE